MSTAFTTKRGKTEPLTAALPRVIPAQHETVDRLVGTRAELDVRIARALEHIMRLYLEGRATQASAAAHALCEAMDTTIDTIPTP